MPFAKAGYWSPPVETSRPAHSNFSDLGLTGAVEQLTTPLVRHSGSFVSCTFGAYGCPGGGKTTAKCASGYTGTACTRCALDHYVLLGKCYECDTMWKKVKSVLFVILVVGLWVVINKFLCEELDSLDVFLAFAQMSNVVGSINIEWPPGISDKIFRIAAILNFDVSSHACNTPEVQPVMQQVDIISLGCIIPGWGWTADFVLQLVLPIFVFIWSFSPYLICLAANQVCVFGRKGMWWARRRAPARGGGRAVGHMRTGGLGEHSVACACGSGRTSTP